MLIHGMRQGEKFESTGRQRHGHHGGSKITSSGISSRAGHHHHHHHQGSSLHDDKRKRHRRTATEIQRHFACPVAGCSKSYGSEGSMN
mmetsp:Transcript_27076/g.31792  ORF Transcript_27076/g.31792 Transcript_27076/m.31792 type:complete len:88 (+) Transcript_27076:219-482(+)